MSFYDFILGEVLFLAMVAVDLVYAKAGQRHIVQSHQK